MISIQPLSQPRHGEWDAATRRMLERRLAAGVHPQVAGETVDGLLARVAELGADGWRCLRDDVEIGIAWTASARPGAYHLLDLDVPVNEALATWAALADTLRAGGGEHVVLDVLAGDAVAEAVLAGLDAPLEATQMQLDLRPLVSPVIALPQRVRLHPMSEEEFAAYEAHLLTAYAQEMLDAGAFTNLDSALAASERSQRDLLPEGLRTPGHHLWTARAEDTPVAVLWIRVQGAGAFIYDIEVRAEQRRRGYGREVLDAGALAARDLGAEVLGLNVFGHNDSARALYERAGYRTTERTYRVRF